MSLSPEEILDQQLDMTGRPTGFELLCALQMGGYKIVPIDPKPTVAEPDMETRKQNLSI